MPSHTTGARSIIKQIFSCSIRKIECKYILDNKNQNAILYEKNCLDNNISRKKLSTVRESNTNENKLKKNSNQNNYKYYFITNYEGKEITLDCKRIINKCSIEEHHNYVIKYIDIESREQKIETKDIANKTLKLYFFDLFYRQKVYAQGSTGVAKVGKTVIGSILDFLYALRFLHLPNIKTGDKYECLTSLQYKECPQLPTVPLITIQTYPDIEFSLDLYFGGHGLSWERHYNPGEGNKDTGEEKYTAFKLEFNISYASIAKKISIKKEEIEEINKSNIDSESKKGIQFYETIQALGNYLKNASEFSEELKEIIESYLNKKESVDRPWISGEIEICPSLKALWHYSTREDLSKIGRYIDLTLEIEYKGELTIDLIEVGRILLKKANTTTTAAAVTVSVGTAGFAALPALLIKILVHTVVSWLIKKLKEGIKFDIIFSISHKGKSSINIDTCKDDAINIDNGKLETSLGISLVAGFEIKTSWSLVAITKAEDNGKKSGIKLEASALANTETSLTSEYEFSIKEGFLGLEIDYTINPFSIKIEFKIVGSFEIFGYSLSQENTIFQWAYDEIKVSSPRFNFLKLYDTQHTTQNSNYNNRAGGGGGGGSF